MSSPNLKLVRDGEVPDNAPSYPDALRLLERYRRDLDGKQLRIANLEAELEQREEQQAGAADIREVLDECKRVLMPRLKIVPGSEAWQKVKTRLGHFELVELKAVPHGAKRSRWHMAARHRLAPKYMFRSVESTQELSELGLGIVDRQLANGLTLSPRVERRLAQLRVSELDALDRCDCGALRFEHPLRGCREYDDILRRSEEWIREQRRLRDAGRSISEPAQASLALDEGTAA